MNYSSPSTSEWKALFESAIAFRDIACWNWMYDSDIFGVQNPKTDEIGYCCILGANAEMFGMAVYLGTDGLAGYKQVASGKYKKNTINAVFIQKCLMVSFENKSDLEKVDKDLIKSLGLNIKGQHSYPMFRDYTPGLYPWFINREQAQYLTLCLQQAKIVAERFKNDASLLDAFRKDEYLVRTLQTVQGGVEWQDVWMKPKMVKDNITYLSRIHPEQLNNIKTECEVVNTVWEFDCSFKDMPIQDNENSRPYFPRLVMCVDKDSGFILHIKIFQEIDLVDNCQIEFIKAIRQLNMMPKVVEVMDKKIYSILLPITSLLSIDLKLVKNLKTLKRAQREMDKLLKKYG